MKRCHVMPFGAQYAKEATAFRLWAPGATRVDLVLEGAAAAHGLALQPADDGFYERSVEGVTPGARYAFRIDEGPTVPDPASRANPDGVHAASMVVDPASYDWQDGGWRGRPWAEAVVYELHVGTFTPAGTFAAAIEHLDALVDVGVTAIELMPLAAFGGTRNWGYDGVLPFAPAASYGTPDDLKRLIDAGHARGLMMLVDVVYNHFGPDGNYLHLYAPQFFNPRHRTPWGAAINFDAEQSGSVRDFFVHNALYWLDEFHFDGLRLDAIDAIIDDSRRNFVTELTTRVRTRADGRHVHIILENDRNEARYLGRDEGGRPVLAAAQWNDDLHHALHVVATGERFGYYADYEPGPRCFARALAEGFVYQGQTSRYREGRTRGERSGHLPPDAFVSFAQNHDQVGNRAFGERLVVLADHDRLRALVACLLLSPQVPMLFMGEEFGATTSFLFFCDFQGGLAKAVTEGRRQMFARLPRFRDRLAREAIPDPNALATFEASKLDWDEAASAHGEHWRHFYRRCLTIRRRHIVPLVRRMPHGGTFEVDNDALIRVTWPAGDARLHLVANLSSDSSIDTRVPRGEAIFATDAMPVPGSSGGVPPYGVAFIVEA
ncbi:MAG TPA: malto-oligosyltrehalose trehalohydrolase [Casimicrobiaceae bacterium]|nr:malto-oligosyltrehalose trehalohydrolase [Casimicrobiaceae bacterium]